MIKFQLPWLFCCLPTLLSLEVAVEKKCILLKSGNSCPWLAEALSWDFHLLFIARVKGNDLGDKSAGKASMNKRLTSRKDLKY